MRTNPQWLPITISECAVGHYARTCTEREAHAVPDVAGSRSARARTVAGPR